MPKRKPWSYPLTLRQKLLAETELLKLKKLLAADKRRHGVYDDSRGLRYLSPALYIKLGDYAGGLKYLKWFEKNFPDDTGMPDFLLEWTIILFKTGKIKEAERKVYQIFFSNTYLLDAFLGKPVIPVVKWEGSNWEVPEYTQYLVYQYSDPFLIDFTEWLSIFMNSGEFKITTEKYIALHIKLKFEKDQEMRTYLLGQIRQLENKISL
jgi:hypothetical protein